MINLSDPSVQKRLATQWGYVPASEQANPIKDDLLLRSYVADLLHLLQFARIECPSYGDSEQAEATMVNIKSLIEQGANP